MNRSIMLVFAHPDDESFGLAGTIAKYARQGVPVDLVTATRGEVGTRLGVPDDVPTGVAREAELREAGRIMGLRDIYLLGYIDGQFDKADPAEAAAKVEEIVEKAAPEVLVTFGPGGITGHPDHIAAGRAATAAFQKLAAAGRAPRKLYYVTIPASVASARDFGDVATRPDDEVTTEIDISDFVELKIRAIAAHRSQQDARDFLEMLKQGRDSPFTHREFLYLVNGRAPAKEADLFQ